MTQYATTTDLQQLGLPAEALTNVSAAIQNDHLLKAGGKIDSYLRSQYTLPLAVPYPDEIILCNVNIASYTLLKWRGFNADEMDENFRLLYLDCVNWLEMLNRGEVSLGIDADATPGTSEGGPKVSGQGYRYTSGTVEVNETRGW